jgi:hypothetical protein
MYDAIHGDHRVIYEDGTWIARDPDYLQGDPSDASEDLDPQEQYYTNLLRRYQSMRKTMDRPAKAPPSPSTKKPNTKRIASAVPKNRHAWLYVLDREYPTPTLVSGMTEEDVLAGLKYSAHSLDRFESITKQKSCWIWALLAKAPEAGTMDYLKIGCIRDLGHKAGQFGLRLRSAAEKPAEKSREDDEDDVEMRPPEEEDDVEEGEVDEGEEAYEPPENTTPVVTEAQANGEAQRDVPADSEAEMSISSEEEGEERQNLVPAPAQTPTLSRTNDTPHNSTKNEPASLEDARARLLAQLGDRLVQAPTTTAHDSPRQHFTSRAEAERYRDNDGSVPTTAMPAKEEAVAAEIDIPDLNTRVTIDMVLTVVAECYGQRDLLRFREIWEAL